MLLGCQCSGFVGLINLLLVIHSQFCRGNVLLARLPVTRVSRPAATLKAESTILVLIFILVVFRNGTGACGGNRDCLALLFSFWKSVHFDR